MLVALTDKNGKKIFEGDVIKVNTVDTHEIWYAIVNFDTFFDENSEECYIGFYIKFDGVTVSAAQLKEFKDLTEVIGNIYDNPEIIEAIK